MAVLGGRGAWPASGRGGTLRAGAPGPYYELAGDGIPLVGSQPGVSPDHLAVTFGVIAIQKMCNMNNFRDASGLALNPDGIYGRRTAAAVATAQSARLGGTGIPWTLGRVDAATAFALFEPLYQQIEERYGLTDGIVGGGARTESGHDPGAVGNANAHDYGLVQINADYHGPGTASNLAVADMFNPYTALDFLGAWYRRSYDIYGRWDCTVASWHNPGQARTWARTGSPPNPEIALYAANVLAGGRI
jgi:soluble lytic murein transglycosylase-like protein